MHHRSVLAWSAVMATSYAALAGGCSLSTSPPGDDVRSQAALVSGGDDTARAATTTSFGDPLPGLTAAEPQRFSAGRTAFANVEVVSDGLGPVFNDDACGACHAVGAVGGGGTRVETRFGRVTAGVFDPLPQLGGSLIQSQGIGFACAPRGSPCATFVGEVVPAEANVQAGRLTTPLFGLGLVDAVPRATFDALVTAEARNDASTAGRESLVTDVSGKPALGKFGWKAAVPTIHQFSGDAYLNEMGVTNPDFPQESCPQGNCDLLAANPVPALNDDGSDVTAFTDFITFLAPPPAVKLTGEARAGQNEFSKLGCDQCHTPSLTTGPSAVAALSNVTFAPYSDFLLHDMGALGDGIQQGAAGATEMRTAPLWGIGIRTTFLHDGRATTFDDAILAHAGQGAAAAAAFAAIPEARKRHLRAFLSAL
jgi:CxxC motif-containing protein (DUF1111 family)